MSPSQFAATNILPLLARVVLCLAFLPQGWNNLMRDVEYTAHDAQRLRELGVRGITDPDPRKADVSLGAVRGWDPPASGDPAPAQPAPAPAAKPANGAAAAGTVPASPAAPAAAPAGAPVAATNAAAPAAEPAPKPSAVRPATASLAPLTQRGLYTLALLADRARIPFPTEVAWGVSGVQLVGGACVLLGLFSRIWGLLMSVILAGLFVTTSLPVIRAQGAFGLGAEQQNLVLAQMGLFVLALGTFLVGPGAMSLDRAIFRRSRRGAKTKSASA